MLERYKRLVSALSRYFPRTVAYLEQQKVIEAERTKTATKRAPKSGRAGKAAAKGGQGAKKPVRGAEVPRQRPAAKRQGAGIYSAAALKVTASQEQAMREATARAVAAGLLGAPSDEQWAMILARQPLTRIFAGAGSGKSSTLVLRVVFMVCHLGVPIERLTVISFTNASCAELRQRLHKVLAFWQAEVDERLLRGCVRTFHSAMGVLAREALSRPQWFEQLGERNADEPDNPLAGGRLRPAQERLLKQAYQQCYAEDAEFRDCVRQLFGLPAASGDKPGKAPMQPLQLAGELHAAPLFELFHTQAGFMESIGIRIEHLDVQAVPCADQERLFIRALKAFSSCFAGLLREQGLMTFNMAFVELTQMLESADSRLTDELLMPFGNLLIDEFQDISPQIVRWLQALHRRLGKAGTAPTLMAIGDDWQSIYGWRGSSPELFMDFDRHFPSKGKGKSAVLMLQANYRSIEPIIRDAEKVLRDVASKQEKSTLAIRSAPEGGHGVRLLAPFDVTRQLPDLLRLVSEQCQYSEAIESREATAVLLLARRNDVLQAIKAQLDPKLPVKSYTIHRAKGLQAQVAIIVDDCLPGVSHPLRDALYASCGYFSGSYGQAMADESLRLAYVAITRGVSRVFWCTRKPQGATRLLG